MIANYHTHTWRCGHAEGGEGDYALAAVKAGLKILDFQQLGTILGGFRMKDGHYENICPYYRVL